jgi:predicted ATPase with chaperone activity
MLLSDNTSTAATGLAASLFSEESFWPAEPGSIEETSVSPILVETLICTYLLQVGSSTGRTIAERLCLPFGILEGLLHALRTRQILVHSSHAPLNDYCYTLTKQGIDLARSARDACSYVGPVPVPLDEYVVSVEAQTIRAEAPKRRQLEKAFSDILIDSDLFESLGPAINSGAGLFLYGAPGNGKTTLARRITNCFGQHIWIPRTLIDDGQIIKFFDAAVHAPVDDTDDSMFKTSNYDRRWIKIRRPTVIVGGELTMDSLEIRHNPHTNVSEAPLQLKSNCGCLLIDDFGRQRIEPAELLNRWIIPLENRCDYLTIATGKKIQVPFEQLIIFSTNLDPNDLADEAFLRRIPYKIEVGDPNLEEFHRLFKMACQSLGCEYRGDIVDYLVATHYRPFGRPLRRCHARDLLGQIRNFCVYHGVHLEMRPEYFDRVVKCYFTCVSGGTKSR